MSGQLRTSPLDASWRARVAREQQEAMPHGRVVVSSAAPLGLGGLGRHLQEVLGALERSGQQALCLNGPNLAGAAPGGERPPRDRFTLFRAAAPLTRFSPAIRIRIASSRFDARAAAALPPADHLIAFNGTALAQFRRARQSGFESVSLISANSHIRQLVERHVRACRDYPIERPSSKHLIARNLREYAGADRIYVASRYIWESFTHEGFPEERLSFFPLTPDPRYQPSARPDPDSSTFDVVFIGSLVVHKGVPLLLDAFSRLPFDDMRVVLVGGWKTVSMRRFIERACARDPRIVIGPGDPLTRLRQARLCVHPAYEDGFAYAPAEALACGVPLIVSEDTGMKELLAGYDRGLVLPTGDVEELAGALEAAYRGEILDG